MYTQVSPLCASVSLSARKVNEECLITKSVIKSVEKMVYVSLYKGSV